MMDALDCGIDVKYYPRAMFDSTRILENVEGERQQADLEHGEEGEQHMAEKDTQP